MQRQSLIKRAKWQVSNRTIARDLAVKLCLWTAVAVAIAGVALFSYDVGRESSQLRSRTYNSAVQIAGVIGQSVWTFNETEIKSAVNAYALADDIALIRILDEEKREIYASVKNSRSRDIRAAAHIVYRGKKLGRVEIFTSTNGLYRRALRTVITLVLLCVSTVAIAIFAILRLLQKNLEDPLIRLGTSIKRIASGHYYEKIKSSPQLEISRISEEVNYMADKIALREHQIRQSIHQQTLYKTEISIAETIQRSMIASRGTSGGQRIAQYYQPMNNLSGDWMTIIECPGGKVIYAMIGDVTGHGIPQGLVTMAAFGAVQTLRPLVQQNHHTFTPSTIMNILRSSMISVLAECNLAMTVAIIKIDLENRDLHICNAGHPFPITVLPEGNSVRLKPLTAKPQPPFGYELLTRTVSQALYLDTSFKLSKDEFILLFSDGLTEARSGNLKTYQRTFLQILKQQHSVVAPHLLLDQIIGSLKTHLNGVPAEDDICLMLIDTGDSSYDKSA